MISTGVSAVVIAEYTTLTSDIGIPSVWTIQLVDQFDVHKYALLNNKKQCCSVKYTIVRILLNFFQIYLLHGLFITSLFALIKGLFPQSPDVPSLGVRQNDSQINLRAYHDFSVSFILEVLP